MILVTGATGFIGFYLINQLVREGYEVLASDKGGTKEIDYFEKNDIPFIQMDITNKEDFDKLPADNIEAIVNLACMQPANVREDDYDPRDYVAVNVLGVINILEFCVKNNINRVVHTISHRSVQKLWETGQTIGENSQRAIKYSGKFSMYSISESAAEDIIYHYSEEKGIKGIVLRLPPVYGYGHHVNMYRDGRVVKTGLAVFIENAIAGTPIEVWGDAEKGRDIVYVKDVVSAIVIALKKSSVVGLFNIASGKKLSLMQEIETIVRVFSPKSRVAEIVARSEKSNSIESFVYSIEKAKIELGWSPKYSFEEMMIDYKKEMESGKLDLLLDRKLRMLH